jgi:hypothetical protein
MLEERKNIVTNIKSLDNQMNELSLERSLMIQVDNGWCDLTVEHEEKNSTVPQCINNAQKDQF